MGVLPAPRGGAWGQGCSAPTPIQGTKGLSLFLSSWSLKEETSCETGTHEHFYHPAQFQTALDCTEHVGVTFRYHWQKQNKPYETLIGWCLYSDQCDCDALNWTFISILSLNLIKESLVSWSFSNRSARMNQRRWDSSVWDGFYV